MLLISVTNKSSHLANIIRLNSSIRCAAEKKQRLGRFSPVWELGRPGPLPGRLSQLGSMESVFGSKGLAVWTASALYPRMSRSTAL